jgi:hypothetical protein
VVLHEALAVYQTARVAANAVAKDVIMAQDQHNQRRGSWFNAFAFMG